MLDKGKNIQEERDFAALLQRVPPQKVHNEEDFSLSRIGAEYLVSAAGKSFYALFDSGSEISVFSQTLAKQIGVTMLEGNATLHGYGGAAFSAQPGYLPVLNVGKAELRNVAIYITADQNLYSAATKHQANALLGFPVVAGLGRLTFTKNGTLNVSSHSPPFDPRSDVPLWFGEHSLLVPVGIPPVPNKGRVSGAVQERLFMLDTGAGSSFLTDRYFAECSDRFQGPPDDTARLSGAGGSTEIPAYTAHALPLILGRSAVALNGTHVLTRPVADPLERFFGLIGGEVLGSLSSYTLDFRTNSFSTEQ